MCSASVSSDRDGIIQPTHRNQPHLDICRLVNIIQVDHAKVQEYDPWEDNSYDYSL